MKQVHWQLPFGNIDGTKNYRIDIYDDPARSADGGQSWPVQLVGAATPFVTDEDNSDDFFEPVRSQTGVISIVNMSGELSIYDILPADNTDKPVRVVNADTEEVVWQGFLNSETYTQDYNSRPKQINLNVNSVIEGMDSVRIANGYTSQMMYIKQAICNILTQMAKLYDIDTLYDNIYYPVHGWRVLTKIVNMSIFYNIKELINEEKWDYEYAGVSTKDVLSYICKFMGWCVRERGRNLIFTSQGEDKNGYFVQSWEHFSIPNNFNPDRQVSVFSMPIDENEWMGTGHNISVNAGARSVEVIANIKPYNFSIESPDCPYGDLEEHYLDDKGEEHGGERDIDIYFNKAIGSYSNIEHNYYMYRARPSFGRLVDSGDGTLDKMIAHLLMKGNESSYIRYYLKGDEGQQGEYADQMFSEPFYVGSCLCKSYFRKEEKDGEKQEYPLLNFQDRLYCSFLPNFGDSEDIRFISKSIFKMNSTFPLVAYNGFLHIEAKALFLYHNAGNIDYTRNSHDLGGITMRCRLKYGDMYYTGDNASPWSTTDHTFLLEFDTDDDSGSNTGNWEPEMNIKETGGWLIPLVPNMNGFVTFEILPSINKPSYSPVDFFGVSEIAFDTLKVDYIPIDEVTLTNRNENKYYTSIDSDFKEDVSVSLELASFLNNDVNTSTLFDTATQPMETLDYGIGTVHMNKRPEVDLLQRLKRFYQKVNTKLELEVKPIRQLLPTVRIKGYDGKTYLPLSESIDWKTDTSTIQCFEVP